MRSCGSSLWWLSRRDAARVAVALTLTVGISALLHAQTGAADAYRQMREREALLRQQVDQPGPVATRPHVLKNLRLIVADYEALSKTHRTTGYADDALWQAALLAGDAFWSFGETLDRQTALRLLSDLAGRFPASSLNTRAPAYRDRLLRAVATVTGPAAPAVPVSPSKTVPPSPSPSPSVTAAAQGAHGATLTEIRREVLPDVVRVTLFLEEETSFVTERLDNPPRLSIDLRETRVVYALKDARLPYQGGVVKQVRIGPFELGRTRVVLDLTADAGRYSIYPVYAPYRLVVDVARGTRTPSQIARAEPAAAPAKAPAARASTVPSASAGARSTAAGPQVRAQPPSGPQVRAQPAPTGRAVSLSRQLGLGAARIVIDPGHGGHDPGAQGDDLDEAELVLDVALRLEQLLSDVPGVDVIMTRRKHEYIGLEERTAIANRAGADLFLSIHANASPNPNARGVETYFLNFAPNAEAEAIAARENAGSTRTMRNLTDIVRAIAVNDKLDESKDFATRVQSALYTTLRKTNRQTKDLGVKQAPFQVLIGATMPSVLAEISFVTHEREGELLKTDTYRAQIATALFDGIMAYQRSLKSVAAMAEK